MDLEQFQNQLKATPAIEPEDQRKSLRTVDRMAIANKIIAEYSMLKKDRGIFHAQLFSAMDDYLKACNDTGYKII